MILHLAITSTCAPSSYGIVSLLRALFNILWRKLLFGTQTIGMNFLWQRQWNIWRCSRDWDSPGNKCPVRDTTMSWTLNWSGGYPWELCVTGLWRWCQGIYWKASCCLRGQLCDLCMWFLLNGKMIGICRINEIQWESV